LFILAFGSKAMVSTQNPVQLSDWTEPQPDLVVFKPRSDFYDTRKPKPEDVLFTVEIADTSFLYDRNVKLPRFAAAGLPEVSRMEKPWHSAALQSSETRVIAWKRFFQAWKREQKLCHGVIKLGSASKCLETLFPSLEKPCTS
jgi:hypothetical protein